MPIMHRHGSEDTLRHEDPHGREPKLTFLERIVYYHVYNWLVMHEVVIITLDSVYWPWGALSLTRVYWSGSFPGLVRLDLTVNTALNIAIVEGFI